MMGSGGYVSQIGNMNIFYFCCFLWSYLGVLQRSSNSSLRDQLCLYVFLASVWEERKKLATRNQLTLDPQVNWQAGNENNIKQV